MGKNRTISIEPVSNLPLIDCHCHFPWHIPPKNMEESYEEQYTRFFQDGGRYLISSSVDWHTLKTIQNFQLSHDNIGLTAGWAPQTVTFTPETEHNSEFSRWIQFVCESPDSYLGIGEIGLDFHHAKTLAEREKQITIFSEILRKTKHLQKPYILHVRNASPSDIDPDNQDHTFNAPAAANETILHILEEHVILPEKVMWHCFSGPKEWGLRLAKQGYYLSAITSAYRNNKMRGVTADVPLNRLLTETDSHWQAPLRYNDYNTPRNVKYTVVALAHSHQGVSQKEVALQVLKNAKKFFGLDL
jgi:TatD DNase family protein